MTLLELSELLAASPLPDDTPVVVAGHGALQSVTHGYPAPHDAASQEPQGPVLILYVEDAQPGAAGTAGGDGSPGPGELPGDAASVASAEEVTAGE